MSNIEQLRKGISTPKKAFDELFGDVTYVKKIHISELLAYPKQNIFKKDTDVKMSELVNDIAENGVQQPIIVRPKEHNGYNMYEVVSGHRRWQACEKLGMEKIDALVNENLDDDTADKIFVGTNLNQRDELVYSEKAFCYKIWYEANKHQGQRNDLGNLWNSVPEVTENENSNLWNSVPEVKDSDRNIRNYIRLTELTDYLLSLVDEKILPMKAGVALSYLSKDEQDLIFKYTNSGKDKISVEQAENLKKFKQSFNELITEEILDKYLGKAVTTKKKEKTDISISLKYDLEDFAKIFGDMTKKEATDKVYEILEEYFKV